MEMKFVQKFDFNNGDLTAMQISCLKVEEPPTEKTVGAVGLFAMVEKTGEVYKCVEANEGIYTWEALSGAGDENSPRYIPVNKFMVGDNVLTPEKVGTAANWTFDGTTFTHTSGSTEPLRITMGNLAVAGDEWLLTFESTGITDNRFYVHFASEGKTQTYNGTNSQAIALRVAADGDDLLFTPDSIFNGTLTNVQIRKISEGGTELYEFATDSIVNMDKQIAKTGFWNVILGTENTFSEPDNSTRTIAIGHATLEKLRTGNRNVGIGTFSMSKMTDGEQNIAIGADSMFAVKSASKCIAIGMGALNNGNRLTNNIAIGNGAMSGGADSNADLNTAIGFNTAMYLGATSASTGENTSRNLCIGYNTANEMTTGIANIYIGDQCSAANGKNQNVVIGASAGARGNANRSIAIGYQAQTTKENQCVIGGPNITEVVLGGKKLIFNEDGTVTWSAV